MRITLRPRAPHASGAGALHSLDTAPYAILRSAQLLPPPVPRRLGMRMFATRPSAGNAGDAGDLSMGPDYELIIQEDFPGYATKILSRAELQIVIERYDLTVGDIAYHTRTRKKNDDLQVAMSAAKVAQEELAANEAAAALQTAALARTAERCRNDNSAETTATASTVALQYLTNRNNQANRY